jgi:hypothetical protein
LHKVGYNISDHLMPNCSASKDSLTGSSSRRRDASYGFDSPSSAYISRLLPR